MSEAKHTLIWRAEMGRLYADDTCIAKCRSEVSAAYILHRLISHAQMLEALRATVEFLTDTEIPFPPQLHDKITDAIHAAEAGSAS